MTFSFTQVIDSLPSIAEQLNCAEVGNAVL
jgi:hypothetical protein